MKPKLTVTSDFSKTFNESIAKFKGQAVLVGIPAADNARTGDTDEGPIGNAAILAINNFGSPANNIPARPVMQIGIQRAQQDIAEQFKEAAKAVLTEGSGGADKYYERAGIIASNSIKTVINQQIDIREPASSTIAARQARGFKGNKALVVTGQLRNSITYVVVKGGT